MTEPNLNPPSKPIVAMTDLDEIEAEAVWEAFLDTQRMVRYLPALNALTGHLAASLLLQQILYRWRRHDRRPFFKFSAPCAHPAYRAGDSWQEELGFSRAVFEQARKRIGLKIRQGTRKELSWQQSPILYWTDRQRRTWYQPNIRTIAARLQENPPAGFPQQISMAEKQQQISNAGNGQERVMPDSNIPYFTKKKQKRTTKRESTPAASLAYAQQEWIAQTVHPAIQAWRQVLERYPRKPTWPLIIDTVGPEPDLRVLQETIRAWLAAGYRAENVQGILDWYQTRLHGRRPGHTKTNNNGHPPVGLVPPVPPVGGHF